MVQFNFTYDPSISVEQRVGFELAAMIWGSYLTDDIEVNLHIASSDSLGENGQAVGGAIPLFHEQNYGVYQQYAEADATSANDDEALASQQDGNTVDFLIDDQVVDGNTDILLTSAQAKALGMDEALTLEGGGTWDRDLVDGDGLDGYILVSNSFDWNYDYTRSGEAPDGTLDFMSMALHEIGHQLGFVSSLDGTLDINTQYSGETQAEGFTVLDLFRQSIESNQVDNPDGAVSDLSLGQNSYFSIDGGKTNLADFADGVDYQASHWKRMQVALGIMDPTLAYQERASLNYLDLQALDVLGWDINYNALDAGLDLNTLLTLAENKVEASLGLSSTALDGARGGGKNGDLYTLGYGEWWAIFEKHVLELGYGEWWSIFEMGYDEWQQQFNNGNGNNGNGNGNNGNGNGNNGNGNGVLELGYGEWWQAFEANVLELGYGEWWQTFEADILELGYGEWWQLLELGYGEWWQKLEKFFFTLDKVDGHASQEQSNVADGGVAGTSAKVYRGGEHDDIIAGDKKQDRIKAGQGDDLIDGKGGHDVIWGEAGDDVIYGHDGNDLIYGGEDNDLILGETHDDELHGGAGHDIVSGGSGDDIVTGGEGKDDLKGGWGSDVIDGGDDNDRLEGEAGNDILIGGEGKDQLNGGGGNDVLYGDAYDGDKSLKQLRTQLQAQAEADDSDTIDTLPPETNALNPIRIEAESMMLTGNYIIGTEDNNASGGSKIRTKGTSQATTTFSGVSGSYMVLARYRDKSGGDQADGHATLEFDLNGNVFNYFTLDQNTDRYYTRTVAQNITLNTGDELTVTANSDGNDQAHFDYLELVSLDSLLVTQLDTEQETTTTTSSTTTSSSSGSDLFRVEAEAMTLLGDYVVETSYSSSGNALIGAVNQGEGIALTTFGGEAGYYNIVVGYYDENDVGIGQISAALNGSELDTWALDQNLGDANPTSQNFLTRTVASTVLLNQGDIFKLTSLRGVTNINADERARIDYVDFVKVDWANDSNTTGDTEIDEPVEIVPSPAFVIGAAIRIEAEAMDLSGYYVESNNNPSGGQLIKTDSNGTATTQFSGDAGYYNIVIAYYDENDGLASISASLGGVELDEWQLDQNLGSDFISSTNKATRTIATQIQVNTGDELRLQGIREYNEFARIDYVEFVPVSAPVVTTIETSNDDFLQGGAGNDTVYGGEGNDTLYGESQGDNSSSQRQGAQTYDGHTYLLSNSGTWTAAQTEALKLGGNLVTINTAAEDAWLRETFGTTKRLWMGMNDIDVEGQFEWVSGEAITYTNWAYGEPNNDNGGQDYGTINYQNQWDDLYHNGWGGSGLQGIIEIDTTDNDMLIGGEGNDTLHGNGGDDELYGDEQASGNNNSNIFNGLVGHWTFDETSGMHVGDSTGNNPGTLVNSSNPVWRTGQVGGALNFYGYTDHVEVSDSASLDITDTLTLTTWVRADTFSDWGGLINKGQSSIAYGLGFTSDGRLAFQANYGSVAGGSGSHFQWSNANLTTQQWHHVAVSYDGNNIQFYIDGQLDSTHQANLTFGTNNEALILGADLTGSHLDGELDDARVYDRALSAEEITQLATGEPVVYVSSEGGNDWLYGGTGNDTIEGGAGNDWLEGTDAIAAGYFEKDLLGGGLGSDTFVLGNANQVYYQGGGERDYATISDFNAFEDIVQLNGSANDYSIQQQGSDTYLYYQGNNSDLVAIFKDANNVTFSNGFTFK